MDKDQIIGEIKTLMAHQIEREIGFRLAYLDNKMSLLHSSPRIRFFQLEVNAFWMSVYSTINYLAHYKFITRQDVSGEQIGKWLSSVFGWPQYVAKAFYNCGRNPIAHTGIRIGSHGKEIAFGNKTRRMYIELNIDDPSKWPGAKRGYLALPATLRDPFSLPSQTLGKIKGQQILYWYQPMPRYIKKLGEDINIDLEALDYKKLEKLVRVFNRLPFLQDDGSMARMNDLVRVYKNTG
jgi:hypothetical protein